MFLLNVVLRTNYTMGPDRTGNRCGAFRPARGCIDQRPARRGNGSEPTCREQDRGILELMVLQTRSVAEAEIL